MGLVDDDVDEHAAGQLLVQLGGGEVHVAGHELPGLDHDLAQDVLGGAALVGRDDVLVAGDRPADVATSWWYVVAGGRRWPRAAS